MQLQVSTMEVVEDDGTHQHADPNAANNKGKAKAVASLKRSRLPCLRIMFVCPSDFELFSQHLPFTLAAMTLPLSPTTPPALTLSPTLPMVSTAVT
jgi:hypothetical protein